jgi:hypothetical protein
MLEQKTAIPASLARSRGLSAGAPMQRT